MIALYDDGPDIRLTYKERYAENEADLRTTYAALDYGVEWVAKVSSLCPLCASWIQRNRGKVVKLSATAQVFQPDPMCVGRGWFWVHSSRGLTHVDIGDQRQYAHAKCARKFCRQGVAA